MRKNFLTAAAGAVLARSEAARDHNGNLVIDVGAPLPESLLAIDAIDLSFSSCGIRSEARYRAADDVEGVRDYDVGLFWIETALASKQARHNHRLFEGDVIGVTSAASIEDLPNPVAKSANSVG